MPLALLFVLLVAACGAPGAPAVPVAPPIPAVVTVADPSAPHTHAALHRGIVQVVHGDAGDLHVEALMMPAGVMFYLSDADQKPLTVDAYSGSAVVKGPSGVVTVDLMAMGDHLHAPASLVQGEPASAVLTLVRDGKATSAAFETQAVGMQSHDHTPLHGGVVSMWGDHHVEYAPKDGAYRIWVTDEHRNPVTGPVVATVKDGATTLPLTADASGMFAASADGAGSRPVTIAVTVDGGSFELGFGAVK